MWPNRSTTGHLYGCLDRTTSPPKVRVVCLAAPVPLQNTDKDPLASDDIPDRTNDRDFADADDVDGVSAHPADEPVVMSMGDVDALGGAQGTSVADLESDSLSDSDLVDLDYKEA